MEQPILDKNNPDEQLYYPPLNYISEPESNFYQKDHFFFDKTTSLTEDIKNSYYLIIRNDINSFTINRGKEIICIVIFSLILIISFAIIAIINLEFNLLNILKIIGFLILVGACPIYLGFKSIHTIYLLLESNSIIMTKKALFSTKIIIYYYGQLERAEIWYKHTPDHRKKHIFILYLIKKKGRKETLHEIYLYKLKKLKGIKFFIDLLNQHIQNNMK